MSRLELAEFLKYLEAYDAGIVVDKFDEMTGAVKLAGDRYIGFHAVKSDCQKMICMKLYNVCRFIMYVHDGNPRNVMI